MLTFSSKPDYQCCGKGQNGQTLAPPSAQFTPDFPALVGNPLRTSRRFRNLAPCSIPNNFSGELP
jgi:hypothetical protein